MATVSIQEMMALALQEVTVPGPGSQRLAGLSSAICLYMLFLRLSLLALSPWLCTWLTWSVPAGDNHSLVEPRMGNQASFSSSRDTETPGTCFRRASRPCLRSAWSWMRKG